MRKRVDYSAFKPGYTERVAGWRLELEEGHAVHMLHPTCIQMAKPIGTDPVLGVVVEYHNAEMVPKAVRTVVKALITKSMRRAAGTA